MTLEEIAELDLKDQETLLMVLYRLSLVPMMPDPDNPGDEIVDVAALVGMDKDAAVIAEFEDMKIEFIATENLRILKERLRAVSGNNAAYVALHGSGVWWEDEYKRVSNLLDTVKLEDEIVLLENALEAHEAPGIAKKALATARKNRLKAALNVPGIDPVMKDILEEIGIEK